jgi:3-hydroxyacyl-[acyl-carrier-protein] dehydratase
MILKDKFYSILNNEKTEFGFQFKIKINENHNIFEGHFPENPVTPGVVQMEIVKELLSLNYNKTVFLTNMPSCKFLAILNPLISSEITIEIEIKDETEIGFRANIHFYANSTSFMKMIGIYTFDEI